VTIDPGIVSAAVAAIVALAVSVVSAWLSIRIQKEKLRTELKLEFAAETAIRELLSEDQWTLRSFATISKRLHGFEENELRKLLIRSGALRFESREDEEMWGLRERNKDKL